MRRRWGSQPSLSDQLRCRFSYAAESVAWSGQLRGWISRALASLRTRRDKSITPTNRRHLEIEHRVARVAAVVQQIVRRFVLPPDLHHALGRCMALAEM